MHFAADGTFPLGDPNPVKQAVIRAGLSAAPGRYQVGMFFDGDGDRIDVYRGDGTYLSSSFVYAAILPEIRRRFAGEGLGVFADLKSNPLAIIEMARTGVTVDVIRNGHSQIKESSAQRPSRFGAVEESAHYYEAFSLGGEGSGTAPENTLYIALLVARTWHEAPARFDRLIAIQATTARSASGATSSPAIRPGPKHSTRFARISRACACALDRMKNGMDLEATLMRRGLPFDVNAQTHLATDWFQVGQRVSQSENGLARWEVVGASLDLVEQTKREIASCVRQFGAGRVPGLKRPRSEDHECPCYRRCGLCWFARGQAAGLRRP